MKQVCINSPEKGDIGKVIDGLYPDINEIMNSGTIPATTSNVVYNQLTELESVGYKVNDDFDAIMIARHLKEVTGGLQATKGTGSSQQAGSSAPVAPSVE